MANYSPSTIARFWSKVRVGRDNQCWEWTASTRHHGYGQFKAEGRIIRANRMAWELFNGEGLGERHALHKCDNPGCCNPNHIYPGDALQNAKDAKERNRRETKLTQRDADLIRRLRTEGISCASIAKDFGISPNHVSRVAKGGAWG